jgi:SNF2 family DNA or RNA helicase
MSSLSPSVPSYTRAQVWRCFNAENQATDRAHRLGQDKPVFVYKLIVAGSIEGKIIALQQKKAALVDGTLANDGAMAIKFSDADLDALFAPIE